MTAGKIRYYGCSYYSGTQMQHAADAAKRAGLKGFVTAQNAWSMLDRSVEPSLVPVCETNNIAPSSAPDRPVRAPANEVSRNDDEAGNQWLEVRHDGYRGRFRLSHQRRLYLDRAGRDLRGEDRFVRESAGEALPFQIRFHLHPDVQAAPVQGGGHVLLKLTAGGGWRFLASEGEVSLEESVYLGRPEAIRRSRQIVVSGTLDGAVAGVKWAFHAS